MYEKVLSCIGCRLVNIHFHCPIVAARTNRRSDLETVFRTAMTALMVMLYGNLQLAISRWLYADMIPMIDTIAIKLMDMAKYSGAQVAASREMYRRVISSQKC